jgi:hypothetical protein
MHADTCLASFRLHLSVSALQAPCKNCELYGGMRCEACFYHNNKRKTVARAPLYTSCAPLSHLQPTQEVRFGCMPDCKARLKWLLLTLS